MDSGVPQLSLAAYIGAGSRARAAFSGELMRGFQRYGFIILRDHPVPSSLLDEAYDLGAALFAEKFRRQIRMVRAPEPDAGAAQHVDLALAQSSAGGVKVEYSSAGTALSFDLLAALRKGEIISIQGDRVVALWLYPENWRKERSHWV